MEKYIAVVTVVNKSVTKYQDYTSESDANAHVSTHGGFVAEKPGDQSQYWIAQDNKLTYDTSTSNADSVEGKKLNLRSLRSPLIIEADHKINTLEDANSDASAWKTYRQKLRDITKDDDLDNPTWPTKPS
jgi:hypothetical protein|tara:strand:- start:85 stop:474 length:390 start_codon:yes stop_codon:yes gene_type:complete